ncbi:MAG: hypothetical protein MPK62_00145 [Alphaproteobacteria bacterium]|nr:hypothetical protein [Alphaproteobacteria bacterium]MDA8029547.1 hypothetical protein [Alphaproteobacteria bacterium]
MKAKGIKHSEWFTGMDEEGMSAFLHRFADNSPVSVCGAYIDPDYSTSYTIVEISKGSPVLCKDCLEYLCDCGAQIPEDRTICRACRHKSKLKVAQGIAVIVGGTLVSIFTVLTYLKPS